jgi:hypothetical protein
LTLLAEQEQQGQHQKFNLVGLAQVLMVEFVPS